MASKYVDLGSGNNSNNGDSWATAYLTISNAETNTVTGDTIFVKGTPASAFTTFPFKENRTYIGYNGVVGTIQGGVSDRTVFDFEGISDLFGGVGTISSVNYGGGQAIVAGMEFKNVNTVALNGTFNGFSLFFNLLGMSNGFFRFVDCDFHDMVFGHNTDNTARFGGLVAFRIQQVDNFYIEFERCRFWKLNKLSTATQQSGYLVVASYNIFSQTSTDFAGVRFKNCVADFNHTDSGLVKLRGVMGTYKAGGVGNYTNAGLQIVKSVMLNTTAGDMIDVDSQTKYYDQNDYTGKSTIWAGNWSFAGRGHFTTAPTATGFVPTPVNTADPQFLDAGDTLGLGRKYKVMNPDYVGEGADIGSGDYVDATNYA